MTIHFFLSEPLAADLRLGVSVHWHRQYNLCFRVNRCLIKGRFLQPSLIKGISELMTYVNALM